MTATPSERPVSVLRVPTPAPGESLAVDIAQNSRVELPFNLENADVTRSGNSLVFALDNGGTVTVTDFFMTDGGELPVLILPEGDEVPAALAFADSGLDIVTAAGPPASPLSGGTSYSDDPGALINGLDKYSMLGTDYWGRSTEYTEEFRALERPGGDLDSGAITDLGGIFGIVGAAFEDGYPAQHKGDWTTFTPAQLTFTFTPTGTTVVDDIRISGFPAGTTLYFGNPNDPGVSPITVTGPGQVFSFTEADFASGVYFVPPKDSDDDFSLNVEIDIHATSSGLSTTITGSAVIIVDAVADYTQVTGGDLTADVTAHILGSETQTHTHYAAEGVFISAFETSLKPDSEQGKAVVTVTLKGEFGDYEDGSEAHYFLVATTVDASSGNVLGTAILEGSLPPGYTYLGIDTIDGADYYRIGVDNSLIAAGNGSLSVDVLFEVSNVGEDEHITWTVGTEAREENLGGGELLYDNNISTFITEKYTNTNIDVVNSNVTVTAGWASEDNNDAKHLDGLSSSHSYSGSQQNSTVTDANYANYGAPITFSLSGASGSAEFIQSLGIDLSAFSGQGSLGYMDVSGFVTLMDHNGNLMATTATIGGVTYDVNVVGANLALTLSTGETGSTTLQLVYQPKENSYDSSEIDFSFNLTAANGEGATAGYSGQSTVVIDAVADMPTSLEVGATYTGDPYVASDGTQVAQTAAKPNEAITISGSANFADNDGSEHHYLVLSITDGAFDWNFTGLNSGTDYLNANALASLWSGAAGENLSASASALSGSSEYIMLEVYLNTSGEWVLVAHTGASPTECTLVQDPSGNWSLSSADAAGISFLETASFNPTTGDFSYKASVTAPSATTDDMAVINSQAVSVEADAAAAANDIEYDRGNNIAITDAETTIVYVSPADSGAGDEHVDTYEDSQANKHVSGSELYSYKEGLVTTSYTNVTGLANAGLITFDLANPTASATEYITEIRFTIDGDLTSQGTLEYNGVDLSTAPSAGSYFYVDGSGDTQVVLQVETSTSGSALTGQTSVSLTYTPKGDHNSLDLTVTGYEVDIVNATSFATDTLDNTAGFTLVVDAVAAKPTGIHSEKPVYADNDDAAQRGEEIEVKFTVTFNDMSDDNEERSLLLELPGSNSAANSADTSYTQLVLTGGTGLTIDMASPPLGITFTEVTINGRVYFKISGADLDSYLDSVTSNNQATVNAELTIKIDDGYSPSTGSGNSAIDYRYGAMTQDSDADAGVTDQNDAAFTLSSFKVIVATVGASVSVGVSSAYENAHWNAHTGYLDRQKLFDNHFDLLKESSAAITVNVTSTDTNESISLATFTVSYAAGSAMAGKIPGQFMYMGQLITLSGTTTLADGSTVTCSVTSGTVSISIENFQATYGADSSLYFVPDHNYSDQDVDLNYYITVTDSASGDSKVFTNDAGYTTGTAGHDYDNTGDQKTIVVDAVAQQAVFSGADDNYDLHSEYGQGYDKIPPGEKLFFTLSQLDLRGDVEDGTEYHLFNLQAIPGYTLDSFTLNMEDGVKLTVALQDGLLSLSDGFVTIPYGSGPSPFGNGADTYFAFNLDDLVNAWNASQNTSYNAGHIGSIDVAVNTPSDGTDTDIHFNISTVDTESDGLIRFDNNKAVAEGKVTVQYSAPQPGTVSITGYVYENATEGFESSLTHPLVIGLGQLADDNDTVTEFSLSLDSGSNGSFWLFDANADYTAFEADYAAYVNGASAYPSLEALLENYAKEYTSIDLDAITSQVTDNTFTGTIIYMPDEDSYSGGDASFSWSITAKDNDSGQEKTNSSSGTITTDAVAQTPEDVNTLLTSESANLVLGDSVELTISATFQDADASTDHYILVEAEAGWSFDYDGTTYSLSNPDVEFYTHTDGTLYYMLPVSPTFGSGDSGAASITVTATAPDNALYWHLLGTGSGGQKDFTIQTGALSKDKDTVDGEITYENNVAVSLNDGFTGTLEKGTGGTWIFEQTKPLYEDNQPDKNTGDTTTASGEFVMSCSDNSINSAMITVSYDSSGPHLTIVGSGVTYLGNGQYLVPVTSASDVTLPVTLSDSYLNSDQYNDTDITIKSVTFWTGSNGDGDNRGTLTDFEVIVDAVADKADITVSSSYYDTDTGSVVGTIGGSNSGAIATDAIVGGEGDDVAYFTIAATFHDTDDSENMYLLVEAIPTWKPESLDGGPVTYTEIYYEGKLYYQIEVPGTGDYTIGMEYVAPINAGDDIYKEGKDGVTSYELTVGTMTKETVSDGETDAYNNVAYNFDKVIVQLSPIDSSGVMQFDSTEVKEGADITFSLTGIATDKHDMLESLEITVSGGGAGGELYIIVNSVEILLGTGGTYTIPDAYLKALADGSASFRYETDGSTEDVTFSWKGEVIDEVSGASGEISGSQTVIVDAVANGSVLDVAKATDADGKSTTHAAIISGGSAVITMEATFVDNTNTSEEHWIVLQQVNGYPLESIVIEGTDCTANVVTKLGSDGNLYYAVNVSGIPGLSPLASYEVEFTVSTPPTSEDLTQDIKTGTITVETSTDSSGNREVDYSDNYVLNVDTVTVHTGVVEIDPDAVTLTVPGAEEDVYTPVVIGVLGDPAANNESVTIEITNPSQINGAFYAYDGVTYTPVTTLTYGETYYFRPDADWSGQIALEYTVTIRDDSSGATETLAKTGSLTVAPVADTPLGVANATESATQNGTHSATATATLVAAFGDYQDGSESHSFILGVPQGVSASGYTALNAAQVAAALGLGYDSTLTYYQIPVDNSYLATNSGAANLGVTLVIDHTYAGVDVSYWAYASDKAGDLTDTGLSDPATIVLDVTGVTLNTAPQTIAGANEAVDMHELVATGTVDTTTLFTDGDGDSVLISQVTGGTTPFGGAAGIDVTGTYGTLNIEQDGNYAYTVNTTNDTASVITIAEGTKDTFSLYGDDGYGGGTTDGADLTFTYGATYHIGTDGNDTMNGVSGEDIFFWNSSHFGTDDTALDVLHGFEYTKDVLWLDDFAKELDLSSVSGILDFLNEGKGSFADNTLRLQDGDWSIAAKFDSTSLCLTVSSDGGMQGIEVHFADSVYALPMNENDAAEILKNLIEQGGI